MKKTVLIIAHISPFPTIQGNRRVIAQLIQWLRAQDLHVVYLWQTWNASETICNGLRQMVDELILVDAQKFDCTKPRNTRAFWIESLAAIQEVLTRLDVRVAIAEYLYMTVYFPYIPASILRITQTIDMLSRISTILGPHGINTENRECSAEEERSCLLKSDVIIAIQDHEASLFRKLVSDRPVITLSYAVTPSIVDHRETIQERKNILLTASRNPLNRDGLLWFLEHVWPSVLDQHPDAQLRVAGEVCVHLLPGTHACIPLGVLDDLAPEFASASVVINPTRYGTGLKIKSLEALAHGKALISTPSGVEGLKSTDAPPFIVAETEDTFSAALISILQDTRLRTEMEARALNYVRQYYSYDAVFSEFYNLFQMKIFNL